MQDTLKSCLKEKYRESPGSAHRKNYSIEFRPKEVSPEEIRRRQDPRVRDLQSKRGRVSL